MNTPTRPTPEALATLRALTNPSQFAAVAAALRGEESAHFAEIISRLHATWQAMPATYATEAQGRAAVAQLHYFLAGADWWIVEKDSDPDSAGQFQAFGIADLGMGAELGYISIPEILAFSAKLDFHYTAQTVAEILNRCVG
jgi:hypothetical protein